MITKKDLFYKIMLLEDNLEVVYERLEKLEKAAKKAKKEAKK